ncbi:uncharacterized protein LOC128471099 [Spea bombifrons]|uniref:uncharacterized protein LOC128471099 n=1 Tax=Spea bombifrons TaxID=233779 RepID=UPI0023496A13|nr:uncharacterized protein LOC128471099 [Spea bombifrons]XP_053308932.1 uncharacterized protein LOC128471099 [Spea bombifrons]
MGSFISRIQGFCGRKYPMKARIGMVGLDGAGKTTILYRLKLNETVSTIPTIGFNVETLDLITDVSFTVWDISFGPMGRPLLKHYLINNQGIVFVVDSACPEMFDDAKDILVMLLEDYDLADIPVIVLANKQDVEGARSPSDIARLLELEKVKDRKWAVSGCCAKTGEGLLEALEILSTMVKEQRIQ